MARRSIQVIVLLMFILAQAVPAARADPNEQAEFTVALDFTTLAQGNVGLVRVSAENAAGVRARFLNRLINFYLQDGVWYCLLSTNMEQDPGVYPLQVFAWFADGSRQTWEGQVEVVDGGFIRQDVTLASELGYLLEPEIDRAERVRLTSIFNQVTPIRYWESDFILPTPTEFTSPFGAWRLYNGVLWGRHTGADLRGPLGTPLVAPAAGRVVLAEHLDVRGNYVLIDHGYGIYSGLAHLSEIHVTRGQMVRQGQVVGVSGSTGRSSGPHIHWEVAVNGEWVDPVQFLTVDLP
jgi:murein DD-endopeptidase MepM/ murein hydrolase activator NlpD